MEERSQDLGCRYLVAPHAAMLTSRLTNSALSGPICIDVDIHMFCRNKNDKICIRNVVV